MSAADAERVTHSSIYACWIGFCSGHSRKKEQFNSMGTIYAVYLKMIGSHWPTCTQPYAIPFRIWHIYTQTIYYILCIALVIFTLSKHLGVLSSHRISLEKSVLLSGLFFFSCSFFSIVAKVFDRLYYSVRSNWRLKNRFFDFYRLFFQLFIFTTLKVWTVNTRAHTKRVNANNSIGCSCFSVSG